MTTLQLFKDENCVTFVNCHGMYKMNNSCDALTPYVCIYTNSNVSSKFQIRVFVQF